MASEHKTMKFVKTPMRLVGLTTAYMYSSSRILYLKTKQGDSCPCPVNILHELNFI